MTELQNDRMTELQNDRQDKNNMPPDLRSRGHKNIGFYKMHVNNIYLINKMTNKSIIFTWKRIYEHFNPLFFK